MDHVAAGVECADTVLAVHEDAESVQTPEDSAAHTEPSTAAERHDASRAYQEQRSKFHFTICCLRFVLTVTI